MLVWGMENVHYEEIIKCLGLMHLDTRRVKSDLTEIFKITNGCYDIAPDIFLNLKMLGQESIVKIFKISRLDTRKYVCVNRIADKWNALRNSCMDCTTLNEFKSKINLEV